MLKKIAAVIFLFGSGIAFGQNQSVVPVSTVPTSCGPVPLYIVVASGDLYGTNGSGVCSLLASPGGSPGGPYLPLAGGTLTGPLNGPTANIGAVELGTENGEYHPAACGVLATAPSWCAGSDFGAWWNAAYAAGTSPVKIITDPGSYSFTTPMVAGTVGKFFVWDNNGALLTYTPSTGTAFKNTSGGGASDYSTIYDLNLISATSAATSTGLLVGDGTTNADYMRLYSPIIMGFQTLFSDNSYGAEVNNPKFIDCSTAANSVGAVMATAGDDLKIFGGIIGSCVTDVSHTNGNAMSLTQTILGGLTANAVVTTNDLSITGGGIFKGVLVHFVNPAGATAHFLTTNGFTSLPSAHFENDATTGSSTSPIVSTGSVGSLSLPNAFVYSAGQTYTNFISQLSSGWSLNFTGPIQDYGAHISDAYIISTRGDRQIMIANPDGEGSTTIPPPGWVPVGTNTVISYENSTQAPNKTQSFKFTTGSQFGGMAQMTFYSVVPGDVYSLQAALKSDGTSTPNAVVQFQTNTGGFVSNLSVITSSTSWVTLTASATVPATAVKAEVEVYNSTAGGSGTSWFDQISVQKSNFPGEVTGPGHWNTQANSGTNLCGSATLSGTGWTGSGLGPYTHSSGTTALTTASCTALVAGQSYLVTYSMTAGGGGTVTPSFGSQTGSAQSTSATFTQYATASSTTALAFTTTTGFTGTVTLGTVVAQGPKATSCGTPVIAQGSTDHAGKLTTAASGCVVTFQNAYTNAPSCQVSADNAITGNPSQAVTNSTLTVTATSLSSFDYECTGLNE